MEGLLVNVSTRLIENINEHNNLHPDEGDARKVYVMDGTRLSSTREKAGKGK